ncbi:MAG: hypothetical protein HRT44_09670 [Bdellovibrionales bacterium]|nr:hypothetical protein [Bdellovibrionales bacterium]NQZ19507.1 hypothetical protein [Bdellovibrionales bacterium]
MDLQGSRKGALTLKSTQEQNTVNINYIEDGFQFVSEDGEKVLTEFTSCGSENNPLLEELCTFEHFYKKGLEGKELRNDFKFCKGILKEVDMLDYYRKGIADRQ